MQAQSEDIFTDVREIERSARMQHRDRMASYDAAIAIADGLLQLEGSGGYRYLQKALEDMHDQRVHELVSSTSDRQATLLQGRCQELKAILALVRQTRENRDQLAQARSAEENRFRSIEQNFRPEPKDPA